MRACMRGHLKARFLCTTIPHRNDAFLNSSYLWQPKNEDFKHHYPKSGRLTNQGTKVNSIFHPELVISFPFRKYVKIGGNKVVPIKKTKVVPKKKTKAGTKSVECGKQSLLETFPKPE